VLEAAKERFGENVQHAVTMTGELAENFPTRHDGVRAICEIVCATFGEANTAFYTFERDGRIQFLGKEDAITAWHRVASANWHASAFWAATQRPDALFIDIGSTTTDIIPIIGGHVSACAFKDAERLVFGELIYTGVTRTSLMALAWEGPFGGVKQRLMAENFCTTADIYRLTGELDARDDSYPASDGRSKSVSDCRARLARMLGRDADDAPDFAWNRLARYLREQQIRSIADGIAQVLSDGELLPSAPFLAAGAGHFLVPELAHRFGHSHENSKDLFSLKDATVWGASVCMPAVAVGLLAMQNGLG
jgi:probable H4MPT-linked C1 transfer pathway protein